MKLILGSNILEHRGFCEFLRDVSLKHSDGTFCITGDLLNIFPEPGEDIRGSICFELYGEMVVLGIDELVRTHFRDVSNSVLMPALRNMFYPLGKDFNRSKEIARGRYKQLFHKIENALRFKTGVHPALLYVPGNMDYPIEAIRELSEKNLIRQVDCEMVEIDGVTIGALGGIPNTAHPFRRVVEISPYEMDENEYARRLQMLRGVDILITHLSPSESPSLEKFLRESPIEMLICRAPFDFRRQNDFRGKLETVTVHGKTVIMVRPFDYPHNSYFVVDLKRGALDASRVEQFEWTAERKANRYEIETPTTVPTP